MAVDRKAQIWAVMGQSGTGKGLWLKAELKRLKPKRIIILDPQDEYGAFAQLVSAEQMARIVTAAGAAKPFAVRYVFPESCTKDHFDRIFNLACKLAYAAKECAFLAEELSNFTTASYGPPLWRRMCNSGRHQGVWVIGCSQFPAQVDKAFLSNATLVHCGWLGEEPHRKAIAKKIDVSQDLIQRLPDLHYLEWHREDRRIEAGSITITGRYTQKPLSAEELATGRKGSSQERASQEIAPRAVAKTSKPRAKTRRVST